MGGGGDQQCLDIYIRKQDKIIKKIFFAVQPHR